MPTGLRRILATLATAVVAACTGTPSGVEPVESFETGRYLGTWYEIMRLDHRFERGLTNVTATYTLREDDRIGVLNRGFDPERCAWREAEGVARFRGSPDVASLAVTFQWPFAGGYHVIALDRAGYGHALVSGPTRDYLWILAREPDLDPAIRERLAGEAAGLGFPVEELILVDHSEPDCRPAS
jgi:apolipoprotein D and lipocalin family protein